MSTLDQLTVFREAADAGNITLASKRLHISQPSVSVHIRNLEREYKTDLFRRTNRGVELTPAGAILYEKVGIILNELRNAKEEIEAYNKNKNQLVSIGATLTIGEYLLPYLIGLTVANDEPFRINAHIANTVTVAKEVINRTIPIGLIEGPIEPNDMIIKKEFWHDELVVVVSPDHPWAGKTEVSFDDLADEHYITREKGSGTRRVAAESLARCGYNLDDIDVSMELSSTKAIKETVAAGAGFSILSALTVQEECRGKRLSMMRVCGCNLSRPLSVITHKTATFSPAEQQFLDILSKKEVLDTLFPKPFLPSKPPVLNIDSFKQNEPVPNFDSEDLEPLENLIAEWNELSDIEQEVCQFIYERNSTNSAALADAFHMTQRNILTFVNALISKGVVEGYGGSKKRTYRLVEIKQR